MSPKPPVLLKHLAKEYNIDPYILRRKLRPEFGYATERRWRWDTAKKSERNHLQRVREFLDKEYRNVKAKARLARVA